MYLLDRSFSLHPGKLAEKISELKNRDGLGKFRRDGRIQPGKSRKKNFIRIAPGFGVWSGVELGFLDLIEFGVIFQNLCRIIEYGLGA